MERRTIGLDHVTLSLIFCLLEGANKVEQHFNNVNDAPPTLAGFSPVAICSNGYKMKKCIKDQVMEWLLFQRYALHMHENRPKVAATQVFQAMDTRPRAWNSYFRRKLHEVFSRGKTSLAKEGSFHAASHVDIILHYYYLGRGCPIPTLKKKRDVWSGWLWTFPNDD